MDEFEIIARYFAPLAGKGAFGLSDDAALIPPRPGFDLIVTTDTIVEGIDFFPFDPPDLIARKALRVNLSDLAAKGAEAAHYLLNLSLPRNLSQDWLEKFAQGLAMDQEEFGIWLLGGDTTATDGPLSIALTAFGFVPQGQMVRRDGARPGDAVYVTGSIGNSGGGLFILKGQSHGLADDDRKYLLTRYHLPQPPAGFASQLRSVAHAGVDVSDGLMADLGHIASASHVSILVEAERVPLSAPLCRLWGEETLLRAVSAGDDYQIAFTAAPRLTGPFVQIGLVQQGKGVRLLSQGREIAVPKPGYIHF